MTTASQAYAVIKARLEANAPAGLALRWQNVDEDSNGNVALPDVPAPFAYTEFTASQGLLASFGGGRGQNRYRNTARIDAFVFVPRGQGLAVATDFAEQIAAVFRSFRDDDVSCFDATVYPGGNGSDVKPPGVQSEVDNYFWAACEVSLFYDLIG